MLTLEGFAVVTAADGTEGLSLVHRQRPALILCDVGTAASDGFGTLLAIRDDALLGDVPFFLLSARRDAGELQRAIDLEADGYFAKPYEIAALLGAINAQLAHQ